EGGVAQPDHGADNGGESRDPQQSGLYRSSGLLRLFGQDRNMIQRGILNAEGSELAADDIDGQDDVEMTQRCRIIEARDGDVEQQPGNGDGHEAAKVPADGG